MTPAAAPRPRIFMPQLVPGSPIPTGVENVGLADAVGIVVTALVALDAIPPPLVGGPRTPLLVGETVAIDVVVGSGATKTFSITFPNLFAVSFPLPAINTSHAPKPAPGPAQNSQTFNISSSCNRWCTVRCMAANSSRRCESAVWNESASRFATSVAVYASGAHMPKRRAAMRLRRRMVQSR